MRCYGGGSEGSGGRGGERVREFRRIHWRESEEDIFVYMSVCKNVYTN